MTVGTDVVLPSALEAVTVHGSCYQLQPQVNLVLPSPHVPAVLDSC